MITTFGLASVLSAAAGLANPNKPSAVKTEKNTLQFMR